MTISPARSIPDSPLYLKGISPRPGFFESEIVGMDYANDVFKNKVSVSGKTRLYLPEYSMIDPSNRSSYANSDIILIRQFDLENGFFIPYPKNRLSEYILPKEEFIDFFEENLFTLYDNGTTKIFGTFNSLLNFTR